VFGLMQMIRAGTVFALGVFLAASLCATTLEQLSMDEMIQKSSAVVRARVTGSYSASRSGGIFTFYRLQIIEEWKSSNQPLTEVAVPGGTVRGVRQTVAGAPQMTTGQEYVLFIWISRAGLPQVIGLSQGLFIVGQDASGETVVRRPAATERMLDQSGQPVDDHALGVRLVDLRSLVRGTAGGAK